MLASDKENAGQSGAEVTAKYLPPHLRGKNTPCAEPVAKWLPPHLRGGQSQSQEGSSTVRVETEAEAKAKAEAEAKETAEIEQRNDVALRETYKRSVSSFKPLYHRHIPL